MASVLDAFRATARARPDHPAVVCNGRELSYAELDTLVSATARRLGDRPGVVGVPATHSPGTVVALLGVWAAGGTYCPVDPAFPESRRQAMTAAAGCRLLLDGDWPPAAGATVLPDADDAGDTAYILFTSGSSGAPKPVATPHRAIAATVASLRDLFGITPADRVLQFASLNWDTCFEEILPTLTGGATLVLHDDAYAGSFPRFLRMLDRERISVLNLPTAYWHELVHHLSDGGTPLPGCVRLVVIGGEAANPARLAAWARLGTGHATLLNTYGCTETTLITHAADVTGRDTAPIGRALPHVAEHVTADGELLIGGPALANGYHGLPAATAERFVTIGGRRYFRTGDRVARLADGTLLHRGRIDQELKIRGIRVDPAEVEAHIAGHPEVGAVAAMGVPAGDRMVLTAYVVPNRPIGDTARLGARIVAHLRGRVPAHLIPTRITVVDTLARTATGKLDRQRIRETVL